ncbi:MAG: hypothetical protein B6D59_02500 [Campylobacteraceae bacterium 4484_4]|nr:MAG: hypothetical protein B6D59_02500 [Campylobacteraceae bacterium 4484_4]
MSQTPKIGLVTVLYNAQEVLEGFFDSLAKQTYENFTLYMIDNSPDDLSAKEAKRQMARYPRIDVRFVKNEINNGNTGGDNQGIAMALEEGADYVMLINNDTEFAEDTITLMVELAESKEAPIVTPKIYIHGTEKIWVAGGYFSYLKGTTPHYGEGEEDRGQYDRHMILDYAPSCVMLIARRVFEDIGVIDNNYFIYYDDTDFIYRAKKRGHHIHFCYRTRIWHKVSHSTGGEVSDLFVFYVMRNRIYFINKNYPFPYRQIALLYTSLSAIAKYIRFTPSQRKALVKAYKEGWQMSHQLEVEESV